MQEQIMRLHQVGHTNREIAKILGISKSMVWYRLNHYVGDKSPTLTKNQEQLLLGSLLGDSSINERERNNYTDYKIDLGHGEDQLHYLQLKHSILQSKQKILKRIRKPGDGGFQNGKPYYRFSYYNAKHLPGICQLCVQNGVKTVTREWLNKLEPFGIAIWFQDDGSAKMGGSRRKDGSHKQPLVYLATNGLTDNELQIIIDYFEEVWNIRFRRTRVGKSKNGQQLVARNRAARRFLKIVAPYMLLNKYCDIKPEEWGIKLSNAHDLSSADLTGNSLIRPT